MLKLLISLSTITTFSLAYSITFDKSFEIYLKPDTLSTQLTISTLKKSEKEVLRKLTSFSTFISGYKDVDKKGGNYSIYPEYRYENNHRYKNGYKGIMHYQISSHHAEDLNTFIANLHAKKRDFDVNIALSSVSWQLSPKQRDGKLDALRLDALIWINNYAKTLSKKLQTNCTVSKISFSSPSFDNPRPMVMEAKALRSDTAPTPEQDDQKITINPHIELQCQ